MSLAHFVETLHDAYIRISRYNLPVWSLVLYQYLRCLAIIQFGVILLPHVTIFGFFHAVINSIIKFFNPSFETAIMGGYRRHVVGLRLCRPCTRLRFWRQGSRMRHYDDMEHLEASASGDCWLCRKIYEHVLQWMAERNNPPTKNLDDKLSDDHELLLWFAETTDTGSGFLDQLRGKSYYTYASGEHPRKVFEDLSSNEAFNLVKEWVGRCDTLHKCWQGAQAQLPTRVIDISQDEPYLLITNGQTEPYITLSHCWGGEQPLTTEIATLQERTKKIPMDTLPALYQDAITVTRELGIKYLWIDSLCILQDCKVDWSKESAKMADVYRQSYLTLSALSAPNCHERMLVQRQRFINSTPERGFASQPARPAREDVFKSAPLCQRAWALQERLLSPRLLYYSKEELFWECLTCTAREGSWREVPYKLHSYRYESYECPQVKIPLVLPLDENPIFPVSLPADWQVIVSEFTRCQLTYSSDKLPALSGLASMFQRNTGYTYIAGLWEENLVSGLLWFCPPTGSGNQIPERSIDHYRGPSWSWVSTNLPVQYKKLWDINKFGPDYAQDIELMRYEVQLSGHDPFGEIQSAILIVRASFYQISYARLSNSRKCDIYDSDGKKIGRGILDNVEGEEEGKEEAQERKQCAAICIAQRGMHIFRPLDSQHDIVDFQISTGHLLMITPVLNAAKEECWQRLGLAWTSRHIPSAPESSVIYLV